VWLVERLAESGTGFTFNGEMVEINHERLSFFGHSQGAMVGALAAPYISTRVRAVGLSAAGGGTAEAAISKVDPIPVLPILASALAIDEERLSVLHPVLGVVQMLSEATDPLNYGPYWFSEEPAWGGSPVSMLMTEGLDDTYTPPRTIESLATAARMPIAGKMLYEPAGFSLRELGQQDLPLEENAESWSGTDVTAGLCQFADVGHFAIYDLDEAKDLYRDFLESAAYDDDPRLK
jgi:pimeloyl-ACP methyl ester carboxylesterase